MRKKMEENLYSHPYFIILGSQGYTIERYIRLCRSDDRSEIQCHDIFEYAREKAEKKISRGQNPAKVVELFLNELFPIVSSEKDNYEIEELEKWRNRTFQFFEKRKLTTEEQVEEFYDEYLTEIGIIIDEKPLKILYFMSELIGKQIYISIHLFKYLLENFTPKKFGEGMKKVKSMHVRRISSIDDLYVEIEIDSLKDVPYLQDLRPPKMEEGSEVTFYEEISDYKAENSIAKRNYARALRFCLISTEYIIEQGSIILPYDIDRTILLNQSINDEDPILPYINEEMLRVGYNLNSYLFLDPSELKTKY